jgi:DNA polymerase III subunit alpha
LSILGAAIDIVKKNKKIDVDIHKIPLDDKKTFEMLAKGETMGVFQLASGGMTKYLTELKPTQIEDLMAMVALYRPGPISQIPEYIRRKHNPKLI